jgi:hypothetical protein
MSDQTNKYDRDVANNRESLKLIANTINKKLQVKLQPTELQDLINFVRGHRTQNWTGLASRDVCLVLAQTYLKSRFTDAGRANLDPDVIDIKEVLKAHVGTNDQEADIDFASNVDENGTPMSSIIAQQGAPAAGSVVHETLGAISSIGQIDTVKTVTSIGSINGILGKTDEIAVQQMFNPQAAYRKNYILLDSRYRDTSQDGEGQSFSSMGWNFLSNTATPSNGGVNSVGDVQQVVAFSTGDIRLPYQNNVLVNAYRRVSMLINEWSGQAYIGQEGRKFHLMFKADIDGNMIDCKALGDGKTTFEFAKPITQLDTITVSFGCPLEPVLFDMDRMHMAVAYTNPVQLTSPIPHRLQTGDQVYVMGFSTADPAADVTAINRINDNTGFNCVVTGPTTIEIPEIDLSALVAPITPLNVLIYFGSKRIFVPVELTYIASAQKKASK